jgi:hypothetical protein
MTSIICITSLVVSGRCRNTDYWVVIQLIHVFAETLTTGLVMQMIYVFAEALPTRLVIQIIHVIPETLTTRLVMQIIILFVSLGQ